MKIVVMCRSGRRRATARLAYRRGARVDPRGAVRAEPPGVGEPEGQAESTLASFLLQKKLNNEPSDAFSISGVDFHVEGAAIFAHICRFLLRSYDNRSHSNLACQRATSVWTSTPTSQRFVSAKTDA